MSVVEATAGGPPLIGGAAGAALMLHIAGGSVAILAGYAALAVRKGARPHRIAGVVFVGAMLVMVSFAALLGVAKGQVGNVFAALLSAYLLGSAWFAVRPRQPSTVRFETGLMLMAASLALIAAVSPSLGLASAGAGAAGSYIFALVAGLSASLDYRAIRRGGLTGYERLRRHLWRMCATLFIATGSAFLGQMDEIPSALHGPHLWALGLGPLGALIFWMIRTRPKRRPKLALAAT